VDYRNLITRFLSREISDEESALLQSWLESDPENRRFFNEENELWQQSLISANAESFKPHIAWQHISSGLGLENTGSRPVVITRKSFFLSILAAASLTLIVALSGAYFWIKEKNNSGAFKTNRIVIATKEGEKSRILLPDSSRIVLNAGSTLQYDGSYNRKERSVHLTGEAFFDVHTDPDKPFTVHAGDMTISATGTRFNVLSYQDENSIVATLEKGKIEVSLKGQKALTIKPGQQAVFLKKSSEMKVYDVSTHVYTDWKDNKLIFRDLPFEDVMKRLSRKYNVEIEIADPSLLDLNYTATFIDESIEEVMEMLAAVSPVSYSIFNRTTADDRQYVRPRIVVGLRKNSAIKHTHINTKQTKN
jgi:transmembrane sensor